MASDSPRPASGGRANPDELLAVAWSGQGYRVPWTREDGVRSGRRLRAVLRGKEGELAEQLVKDVIAGKTREQNVWVATTIKHPLTDLVLAVHLQRAAIAYTPPEPLPIWIWDLPATPGPPRLHLTVPAMDLLGIPGHQRDRTIYGTADFFLRLPHTGDALAHVDFIHNSGEEGVGYYAETPFINDDGSVRRLALAELRVDGTRHILGIGGGVNENGSTTPAGTIGAALADQMAEAQGHHIALVDIRFPAAIYVIRWIGGWPPGVGHGFSTGQAGGVDENDVLAVADLVKRAAERRVPMTPDNLTETVIGIRSAAGDFRPMRCAVWFVDREAAPSVVAANISPA